MKKWLIGIAVIILLVVVIGFGYTGYQLRDRHAGYHLDLTIDGHAPAPVRAGFAAVSITPPLPDHWTDADGDAQFSPTDGDEYEDGNDNGRFDAIWMAGFQNRRPAQGVHDPLWARAMILDDGNTRLALLVLDAIGFMSDDIIDIRKRLPAEVGVDYAVITSTHTHEAPDLLGLWGESNFRSGVDPAYLEYVKLQSIRAIQEAVKGLRPARLRFVQDQESALPLVEDSRQPRVLDPGIRILQAIDSERDTTLGTLFAWANHPETTWNDNLLLSSDFPHYVRQGMEKGVYYQDTLVFPGVGGTTLYVNGAIGGLMTTSPDFPVKDPFRDTLFTEPSFDKAEAQGTALALLGLQALRDSSAVELSTAAIRLRAKTIELPLTNPLYRLAAVLGVIDRGTPSWMKVRSEVAFWQLGPAAFLHQPGELYPEILNGGVASPDGGDFGVAPLETPPLRNFMNADFQFVVGLSNDMIGYIIPKSQWDEEAPFTYGYESAPYGEINSLGPETSPILYQALVEIMQDLRQPEARTTE